MGNPYIEKEVKKVLENKDYAFPLNQAMGAAWIIANFKGINYVAYRVTYDIVHYKIN